MKHNIKNYKINVEDNGRITLKLEIELQKLGEKRAAFTTSDALQLLVDEGYCLHTNEVSVLKAGIAWNWGGSPNKDDWTFQRHSQFIKTKPAIAIKSDIKQPVKKTKVTTKNVTTKNVTTKKATGRKTTQDILAGLKAKGN